MKKILILFSIISIALAFSPKEAKAQLPDVEFLGEGPGTYTLDPGFDTFIVKEWIFTNPEAEYPYRVELNHYPGPTYTINASDGGNRGYQYRIWQHNGDNSPITFYRGDSVIDYGSVDSNCIVEYVLLDDDPGDELVYWYVDDDHVHTGAEGMVSKATFVASKDGDLQVRTTESVAVWIVNPCASKVEPTCNLNLAPSSKTLYKGQDQTFTAFVDNIQYGSVSKINFFSSNSSIAAISPDSDTSLPYRTNAQANNIGSAVLTAEAVMDGGVRCSDTATITVQEPPSCDISIPDVTLNGTGSTEVRTVNIIDETTLSIDRVDFSSANGSVASVTSPDTSPAFRTTITAQGIGNTNYTATATMQDGTTQCAASANIQVVNPSSWWQSKEGDVHAAGGGIISQIPPSCNPTTDCEAYLSLFDAGEYPGIAIAGGSVSTGDGEVSDTYNWSVESSPYTGGFPYTYDYFDDHVPTGAFVSTVSSFGDLTSGTPYKGYYIGKTAGDFTISGSPIDLGDAKAVLFVNGNLNIDTSINLNDGTGFFLVIAAGDISVNASVGGAIDEDPDLEGVYITNRQLKTGTLGLDQDTDPLHVRGVVIGLGDDGVNDGVVLERSLTDNSNIPAELFEYGPDQSLAFPDFLLPEDIVWREVAP